MRDMYSRSSSEPGPSSVLYGRFIRVIYESAVQRPTAYRLVFSYHGLRTDCSNVTGLYYFVGVQAT